MMAVIENSVLVQLRSSLENALERQQKALDKITAIQQEQADANKVYEERISSEQGVIDSLSQEVEDLKNAISILEATLPKLPEADEVDPPESN
jgi:septal ring factor EnvC (AmiA/AmiB activator)